MKIDTALAQSQQQLSSYMCHRCCTDQENMDGVYRELAPRRAAYTGPQDKNAKEKTEIGRGSVMDCQRGQKNLEAHRQPR